MTSEPGYGDLILSGSDGIPIIPLTASDLTPWLDTANPIAARWVKAQSFDASPGTLIQLPDPDGNISAVLVGVGDLLASAKNPAIWALARAATALPPGTYRLDADQVPRVARHAMAVGWALSQYRYRRFLPGTSALEPRILSVGSDIEITAVTAEIEVVAMTRDLVNTPTNYMLPDALEAVARAIAHRHDARCHSIVGDALLEENFPTIHAVGRASEVAPRLIELNWGEENAPQVTIVGKGVCFDSGGLDLKPANGMRWMKKDMGGAAHALALADWVMRRKLPIRLQLLVPAVENAVAGNAFRPGDVLTTRAGITVEIGNTDAEGRLILCDALSYANERKPQLLLDFATLTGAARVALGGDLPAFFTPDDDLAQDFAMSSETLADPLWRLPLWAPYLDDMKSYLADVNNINEGNGGFAGAITAALYLQKFVDPSICWGHFDVYSWNAQSRPGRPKGGEAMALRAAFDVIRRRFGDA
ncbi:MAG: leucyl aminopeptidase family protein [Pseudomonadota bacterium]